MFEDLPPFLLLGLMILLGFYVGKIVKLVNLPSLLGYMLVGVLIGPSLADVLTDVQTANLGFVNELALGLVAFTIGSELNLKVLRRQGKGIMAVILSESFGAFLTVLAVVATFTWLTQGAADWPLALLFAALAPASAPAGTVAVIQEFRAKGPLTTALYAVVGFDDGLAVLLFGFAFALAKSMLLGSADGAAQPDFLTMMWPPLREVILSFGVGAVMGYIFCFLLRKLKNRSEYLILVLAFVFLAVGLSGTWHMSLILTNLVIGFVLVNTRNEALVHRVGEQVTAVMPVIFILFFCLAGAHLHLASLPKLGLLGLAYIAGRSAGLVGGSRVGARIGKVNDMIRNWIGLGILSQAGVAIGLALIVNGDFLPLAEDLAAQGQTELAERLRGLAGTIITTITATCIFFEIIGPILTKLALSKAGEIPEE
jgi:Kef-type K+ transport system membrane component KefB